MEYTLGFPCYVLGYWMRIKERMLTGINDFALFGIVLGALACNVMETIVAGVGEFFFSSVPFMLAAFVLCLKHPNLYEEIPISNPVRKVADFLQETGRYYTFSVYIWHPIVREGLVIAWQKVGNVENIVWRFALPILTMSLAWAISRCHLRKKSCNLPPNPV